MITPFPSISNRSHKGYRERFIKAACEKSSRLFVQAISTSDKAKYANELLSAATQANGFDNSTIELLKESSPQEICCLAAVAAYFGNSEFSIAITPRLSQINDLSFAIKPILAYSICGFHEEAKILTDSFDSNHIDEQVEVETEGRFGSLYAAVVANSFGRTFSKSPPSTAFNPNLRKNLGGVVSSEQPAYPIDSAIFVGDDELYYELLASMDNLSLETLFMRRKFIREAFSEKRKRIRSKTMLAIKAKRLFSSFKKQESFLLNLVENAPLSSSCESILDLAANGLIINVPESSYAGHSPRSPLDLLLFSVEKIESEFKNHSHAYDKIASAYHILSKAGYRFENSSSIINSHILFHPNLMKKLSSEGVDYSARVQGFPPHGNELRPLFQILNNSDLNKITSENSQGIIESLKFLYEETVSKYSDSANSLLLAKAVECDNANVMNVVCENDIDTFHMLERLFPTAMSHCSQPTYEKAMSLMESKGFCFDADYSDVKRASEWPIMVILRRHSFNDMKRLVDSGSLSIPFGILSRTPIFWKKIEYRTDIVWRYLKENGIDFDSPLSGDAVLAAGSAELLIKYASFGGASPSCGKTWKILTDGRNIDMANAIIDFYPESVSIVRNGRLPLSAIIPKIESTLLSSMPGQADQLLAYSLRLAKTPIAEAGREAISSLKKAIESSEAISTLFPELSKAIIYGELHENLLKRESKKPSKKI